MKKAIQITKAETGIHPLFPTAVLLICVALQGGFFPSALLFILITVTALCFFVKKSLSVADILFLAFSLFYLFCSVRNGFSAENAASGLLPLCVLMFKYILPESYDGRKRILSHTVSLSAFFAVIAVIKCIADSVSGMTLVRIAFPFGYSNASGIFFAVMLLLSCKDAKEKKYGKVLPFVFLAALILTQSVGALVVTFLAMIFLRKDLRFTICLIVAAIVFVFIFRGRVLQSLGTFSERLVQIYDGIRCIADNPVFGIGAGQWEVQKHLWQSGFYSASTIHGSIVLLGVNSGIIGLLLFSASAVMYLVNSRKNSRECTICIAMIMLHSLTDLTFLFPATGFLIFLMLPPSDSAEKNMTSSVNIIKYTALALVAVYCVLLSVCLIYAKNSETILMGGNADRVIESYEKDTVLAKSEKMRLAYLSALYAKDRERDIVSEISETEFPTDEEIILLDLCSDSITESLGERCFNTHFYEYIEKNKNQSTQKEAEKIHREAVTRLSFFGKLLYKFQGGILK